LRRLFPLATVKSHLNPGSLFTYALSYVKAAARQTGAGQLSLVRQEILVQKHRVSPAYNGADKLRFHACKAFRVEPMTLKLRYHNVSG